MADRVQQIRAEFDVFGQCRKLRLKPLECPRFLFLAMGMVTILFMTGAFLYLQNRIEPEMVALIAAGIAVILVIQTYIIVLAFEKLAEINRLKSEFINIMSHQIRSPLTAARWAIELLDDEIKKGNIPSAVQRFTSILYQSADRMSELVNSLLVLARIEADQMRLTPEKFSLRELVEGRIKQTRPFAEALNIKISLMSPDEEFPVFLDREQTRFIFENFLDNAVRYSRAKGRVLVTLEKRGSSFVRCSIQDSGIGVPRAEQARIFSQFFRASNAMALSPTGTGLGLYISREIAKRLGGDVGFSSEENKGSTFWFILPLTGA